MTKHVIARVSTDVARQFWEQQEDARIFLHPDVLDPLCERVDWWLASWNLEPACLWPMCHAADGSHRPPELSSYVGPLWHDAVGKTRAHRWWTISRTIQQAFLDLFVETYGSFEFELPPGSSDVRVLNWFREENSDSVRLQIDCRHTAIIRATADGFPDNVLAGFSRDRHKDLGRTSNDMPGAFTSADHAQCVALYETLLETKAVGHVAKRRRAELISLLEVAASGLGTVLVNRDQDGIVEGFTVSLLSRKTASMVVVAASAKARARGLSTRLRMQDLAANSQRGAVAFDFLGANSPAGAEEKHRYGAWPEMYFHVSVGPR